MGFTIDPDGILGVSIEHKASNASVHTAVTNDVDRLSEERIEDLIKDAERFQEEDKSAREEIAAERAAKEDIWLFVPASSAEEVGERCTLLEAARAEAAGRRSMEEESGPEEGHL